MVGEGDARVQPLHQDDVAAILIASINNKKVLNKIIPLGGPETFSYNDLGQLFGKVLKQQVNVIHLAPDKFKKEYFNSDVILFRASSDSILTKKNLITSFHFTRGLSLQNLKTT